MEMTKSSIHETIQKKDQEINKLKSSLAEIKLELDNSNAANRESLNKKENEIELLKSEFTVQSQNLSTMNSELERKCIDSDSQIRLLKQQLENKNQQISYLEDERRTMNDQFQSTIQQIRDRDLEISNLRHSMSLLPNELDSNTMKKRIELLESDLEFSRSKAFEVSKLQGEKDALQQTNQMLDEINSSLKSKVNEQELAIHTYQEQVKKMQTDFLKVQDNLPETKTLIMKMQRLMTKVRQLETKIESQQSIIDEMKVEKKVLHQKSNKYQEQLKDKNHTIQKMKESINESFDLDKQKSNELTHLKNKMNEYESAMKLLVKKMKQKEAQHTILLKENKELKNEFNETKETLDITKTTLLDTQNELSIIREELSDKTLTLETIQERLRESTEQARDLSTVQTKLEQQNSLVKACEDRNTLLLSEINSQEEKIKLLNEKNIEVDQALKKIKQENLALEKNNETLSMLNKKQERELEDAHTKIIDMHSRLLQYETDMNSSIDSIKNLSLDKDRDKNELRLVQSYVSQERAKYRSDISSFQKQISEFIVEKTDLQHTVDQLNFELKTIQHLLESKENELKFEQTKHEEDIRNAREIASKQLDENKKLKEKLNEIEAKSKQILNEFNHILPTESFHDLPMKIEQFRVEHQKQMNSIAKIKSLCGVSNHEKDSDVDKFVINLMQENDNLIEKNKQIQQMLNCSNDEDILDEISKFKADNYNSKKIINRLQEMCNSDDVLNAVARIQTQNDEFIQQNEHIKSFFPEFSKEMNQENGMAKNPRNIFDIVKEVKTLTDENSSKTRLINSITDSLGCDKNSLQGKIDEMKNKIGIIDKLKEITNLSKDSDDNQLYFVINKLNNENASMNDALNEIKKNFTENFPNNLNKSELSTEEEITRIKSLVAKTVKENNFLKVQINNDDGNNTIEDTKFALAKLKEDSQSMHKIYKKLNTNGEFSYSNKGDIIKKISSMKENEKELQEILQTNDIKSSVQKILLENEKYKKSEDHLTYVLEKSPQKHGSHSDRVAEVLRQNEELKKMQQTIKNILPNRNLQEESPEEQILNLLNENKSLKSQNEKINRMVQPILSKDSNEKSLQEKINDIINENEELKRVQKSASSLIPSKEIDFISKVKDLVSQYKSLEDEKRQISMMLPYNMSKDTDLKTRISELLNENSEMKSLQRDINYLLPQSNETDLKGKVQNLVSQNKKLMEEKRIIESMLPRTTEKMELQERINNLLVENTNFKRTEQRISRIIPNSERFLNTTEKGIEDQVREFVAQNESLTKEVKEAQSMIPGNHKTLKEAISHVLNENQRLKHDQNISIQALPSSMKKINGENLPNLIKDYVKQAENYKNQIEDAGNILPGDRKEPISNRITNLISESNKLKDSEMKMKTMLADFSDDEDVVSSVKSIVGKVHEVEKIIPTMKGEDFVLAVKDLVNDKKQLLDNQKECYEMISESLTPGANSLPEKISSLLNANSIYKDQQEKIESMIFAEGEPHSSIEARIREILNENQELKNSEAELAKLIPIKNSNDEKSLQEGFRDIIKENEQILNEKENVQKLLLSLNNLPLSSDNNGCISPHDRGSIEQQIQALIDNRNSLEEAINEAESALPPEFRDLSNSPGKSKKKSLKEKIESLVEANEQLKSEKNKLIDLISPEIGSTLNLNSSGFMNGEINLTNSVQSMISTLSYLRKILPKELSNENVSLPEAFKAIVNENNELKKQKDELQSLMSADSPTDLTTQLQNLLAINSDLKQRFDRIMSMIPGPPATFDDLLTQLRYMIDSNLELQELRVDIESLLTSDANSRKRFLSQLNRLSNDNQLHQIKNLVDQCDIYKMDSEVLETIKVTLESNGSDPNIPVKEIERLIKVNNEYQEFTKALFEKCRCDSPFDVFKLVSDLQLNFAVSYEFNQKLFDAISAPSQSPIRIVFPVPEVRKTALMKLIDTTKQRIIESQHSIALVIDRARRSGFNGDTLRESVRFLEEMAAVSEKHKVEENIRLEIEELRELNNKQQKVNEQHRDKFRKRLQEKMELIEEIQESCAQREQLAVNAVEEEKKKTRQLEIIGDRNKRIIEELLRVMNGKGADIDFLREHLSSPDAAILQYAKIIHEAISKVQKSGNFVL
ncbi:hypothetical protein TRFO_25737 [Tritrichomonas foetus]|uniref:Uncharacterized protein n=1 Tax=Tritrichomonas foetus TaxID=1144522 RepID=A0A1J4K9A2_9EUKA|nr:hypothetical protein TRFO_25737 [Tritrichomonas foetus]|eukprot:OHT06254.1 hypothetical protein TRFO_25737 [Tritrichomonas foetus]